MNEMLNTSKPEEEPPEPTKKDLQQRFRIVFRKGKPRLEEVEDDSG